MGEATEPELLFFLGAGASVAAGVPDTFKLVNDFVESGSVGLVNRCKNILRVLYESRLAEIEKRLEKVVAYFEPFKEGRISLPEYFEIRKKKYPQLENEYKKADPRFALETIERTIKQTEEKELGEILGGVHLRFREK